MNYASGLGLPGMPWAEEPAASISPGTAGVLAGDYAKYLMPSEDEAQGDGFQLRVREGGPITPGQRSILETIVSMLNNAPRVGD